MFKAIKQYTLLVFILLITMASSSIAGPKDNSLWIGNAGEPDTLNPPASDNRWTARIFEDIYEGLTTYSADGSLIPGVAEKWDVSDDGLKYVFYLRQNAKWSDGTPLTAHDFEYSFRTTLTPSNAFSYAWVLFPIKNAEKFYKGELGSNEEIGVKATDDHTLEITLKDPVPYFLNLLTFKSSFPVPKHVIDQHGKDWSKPENIVTNGAYMVSEWRPQEYLKAIKNPHFHSADSVSIDTLYYDPTEDRGTIMRRFRAGELDVIADFPHNRYKWAKKNLRDAVNIEIYLNTYYYPFNLTVEPFNDIRIRKALSLAINREMLVKMVTGAGEEVAYNIVPEGLSPYVPQLPEYHKWNQARRDLEAQKLMEEAGYGPSNPLKFKLRFNTSENHEKIAIAISQMWKKKLGVQVELFNSEAKTHYADLRNGQFEVARAGWIADYPDPENFLSLFHSSTAHNYSQYKNKEYDALLDQAAKMVDQKKRAETLQNAEKIINEDIPVISLFRNVRRRLISPQLSGWENNTKDVHMARYLSWK